MGGVPAALRAVVVSCAARNRSQPCKAGAGGAVRDLVASAEPLQVRLALEREPGWRGLPMVAIKDALREAAARFPPTQRLHSTPGWRSAVLADICAGADIG